jgi:hypothetical protein
MITCASRPLLYALVLAAFVAAGCEKSPLLAPTGSSITLTSATTVLPINGTATIVAQVLENAGTPPHSGTRVTFTTTLGSIDPTDASTDSSGRATATFRGTSSGIAIIGATSGGATTSTTPPSTGTGGTGTTAGGTSTDRNLRIAVGAAAASRVSIAANPAVLPTNGGSSTITASVFDVNGSMLSSTPVTFATTAGTISATTMSTDASGNASIILTTFQQATVTATVGAGSSSTGGSTGGGTNGGTQTGTSSLQATVVVNLTSAPTVAIKAPDQPPSAGLPGAYSITVTPANSSGTSTGGGNNGGGGSTGGGTIPIREVVISWGDGINQSLGAVSGEQAISHVYAASGSYVIGVRVTDVAGGSAAVSTSVSVIPVPQAAVVVTASPPTIIVNGTITFTIQVTVPPGIGIQTTTIDFGDGEVRALGGATSTTLTKQYTTAGVRTVTVTVLDTTGRTTIGTATVSVTP